MKSGIKVVISPLRILFMRCSLLLLMNCFVWQRQVYGLKFIDVRISIKLSVFQKLRTTSSSRILRSCCSFSVQVRMRKTTSGRLPMETALSQSNLVFNLLT